MTVPATVWLGLNQYNVISQVLRWLQENMQRLKPQTMKVQMGRSP
jgi:hypothetical protein